LINAAQTSWGRTPAMSIAAAQANRIGLRGLLQLNNRKMSPTSQVRHAQLELLAAPPADTGGGPAWVFRDSEEPFDQIEDNARKGLC